MDDNKCAIWGTPCKARYDIARDFSVYDSPRVGGKYALMASVGDLQVNSRKALTQWISEQHSAGVQVPEITTHVLDSLNDTRLLSVTEKINKALLFVGGHLPKIGTAFHTAPSNISFDVYRLMIETECEDIGELNSLLGLICDMRLLARPAPAQYYSYFLTPDGWLKFDELKTKLVDSTQAFIAMWFDDVTSEPYENGFARAIRDSGYKPIRIDKAHFHNKIDDEIIAQIRRSRFVVVDFTCAPNQVRGGVYFEAGFAMGLNIPIIWTCHEGSIDDLHFDTRQYPHIVWSDSSDLYDKLTARVGALLGDGPNIKKRS